MIIRTATPADVDQISAVESASFPPAEAATHAQIAERVAAYGDHFWLMVDDGRIVAIVDGMVTDARDLADEMYADASMHDESGAWQMIFGVATDPAFRRRGLAGQLLERAIADSRAQGRLGLVLTCKDALVHYYAKFGFVSEGRSESEHGGVAWNQMRLTF